MRYLLISFLIGFASSCSLSTTKGFLEQSPSKDRVTNTYFSNAEIDYVYKINLEVYKHHFGGLLIVKKLNDNHHRVVFTTEFGKKMMDFEYIGNQFKVNYMFEDLNKKIIVNTLSKDFKLLVNQYILVDKEFTTPNELVYQTKQDKRNDFYFYNKETIKLEKIVSTSNSNEKITIFFNEVKDEISKEIKFIHKDIKMKIHLNYISN